MTTLPRDDATRISSNRMVQECADCRKPTVHIRDDDEMTCSICGATCDVDEALGSDSPEIEAQPYIRTASRARHAMARRMRAQRAA